MKVVFVCKTKLAPPSPSFLTIFARRESTILPIGRHSYLKCLDSHFNLAAAVVSNEADGMGP
jgi:hypothetical protein